MQRMQRNSPGTGLVSQLAGILLVGCLGLPGTAIADLIRPSPARGYPEIAGNVVGSQTYSFDPVTKTGTFRLVNAPHALELGPQNPNLIPIQPNPDGTLEQSLNVVLDSRGRLVKQSSNSFQIRGTVVIGNETFHGVLLEGRPTSFGARIPTSTTGRPSMEAFDLNMEITGGELAKVFGSEVYLRIMPQAESTFRGDFSSDFSSEKPLTNLRPSSSKARRISPVPVPEPATLLVFLGGGLILLLGRVYRDVAG
jgi:hypothetical protein